MGKPKAEVAAAFVEKRVKGVKITPHVCKIQDKDEDFYMQFKMVVCGLDSVEARVGMVDPENPESLKPLIDGGSEGLFRNCHMEYYCNSAYIPVSRIQGASPSYLANAHILH